MILSPEEIQRYSRHLLLPEIGMKGQQQLKAASVLLVGAGGLGSPLAMYLAAAGVGRLGLVDFDVVDASNLQRQLLHSTKDIGRPKLESAKERIEDINPHVQVDLHPVRLSSENALAIIRDYNIVADGTDNFPTRYLVNDACVLTGTPNVYGSIYRFEGEVSIFGAAEGPCYRCLYAEPPPPGLVPSCAEGGVLGVLPGIVGSLQALEVIKLITGAGDPLVGRVLLVDTLGVQFRTMKVRRNPECPVCGDHQTVTELMDYDAFCGISSTNGAHNGQVEDAVPEITVRDLKARLDRGDDLFVLDVRRPHEYDIANLGAPLIPLDELPDRVDELEPYRNRTIVLHCRSGARSAQALKILRERGFEHLLNLKGGILAWSDEVDASVAKY
jgi:adenylyltransferase/sulfurtransferase